MLLLANQSNPRFTHLLFKREQISQKVPGLASSSALVRATVAVAGAVPMRSPITPGYRSRHIPFAELASPVVPASLVLSSRPLGQLRPSASHLA